MYWHPIFLLISTIAVTCTIVIDLFITKRKEEKRQRRRKSNAQKLGAVFILTKVTADSIV